MLQSQNDIYRAKNIIASSAATREQADKLFAIFVAMAAAMSLDLPASRQLSAADAVISQHIDTQLREYIGCINEVTVMDFNAVCRLAIQFYNFRYAMAYGGLDSMAFAYAAFTGCSGDNITSDARTSLNAVREDAKVNDAFNLAMRIALNPNSNL